jgi:hypothetical protein
MVASIPPIYSALNLVMNTILICKWRMGLLSHINNLSFWRFRLSSAYFKLIFQINIQNISNKSLIITVNWNTKQDLTRTKTRRHLELHVSGTRANIREKLLCVGNELRPWVVIHVCEYCASKCHSWRTVTCRLARKALLAAASMFSVGVARCGRLWKAL